MEGWISVISDIDVENHADSWRRRGGKLQAYFFILTDLLFGSHWSAAAAIMRHRLSIYVVTLLRLRPLLLYLFMFHLQLLVWVFPDTQSVLVCLRVCVSVPW